MPHSNWSIRLAALGASLLLAFVALGVGAFIGASHTPNYGYPTAENANRPAQAEQAYTSQIDRDRPGLSYLAERVASGPDPSGSAEREKRDLAAQESMSVSAFWMLAVSAVGTVTTMIGTGFLLWQIMLTREAVKDTGDATQAMFDANKITREIGEAQTRCYVSVPSATLTISKFGIPRIEIEILNSGQSPALDVKLSVLFEIRHAPKDFKQQIVGESQGRTPEFDITSGATICERITGNEGVNAQAEGYMGGTAFTSFDCTILLEWRDVFEKKDARAFLFTRLSQKWPRDENIALVTSRHVADVLVAEVAKRRHLGTWDRDDPEPDDSIAD